ncbi:MAG: hypothetical protein K2X55_05905 [Burkholderiaceae bacterium]|nr:hypothetical protein [Burkholderiaceae bacterium]
MRLALARCGVLLAALVSLSTHAVTPTTFGTVIGSALLCNDQISNQAFYDYMVRFFGPPYKRDGGAWWFRTPDARLWDTEISEVMVSDDSWPLVFVGAVAETTPDLLEQAVSAQSGVRYAKIDSSRFSVRETRPGSRIVYFDRKSKIYCAKFKSLPPALR